jgi:hypothetical protein
MKFGRRLFLTLAVITIGVLSSCIPPYFPTIPGAPRAMGGDGQVFVYWDAVPDAASYEVWYGTENNSASAAKFQDVSGTNVYITGLTNSTTYYVWLKAKNEAGTSGFSGAASGTPAPVPSNGRIYVYGTRFYLNGSRIWISGCNTPWDNWNDFGGTYDASFWSSHYAMLHANRINASRVWITCSGEVGIDIDSSGHVSGASAAHWSNLDDFFATAQSNGMHIMATLISFDHFEHKYTTYQRWRNWINSDSNIDSYIDNYLIPFLARYGGFTALWSIDLVNEPDWATTDEANGSDGTIAWSRFQKYWAKASKAIHENSNVLVTVGIGVVKYNSDVKGKNVASDSALKAQLDDAHVYLDFYSPHYYNWMDQSYKIPFYMTPEEFGMDGNKPCIIGECPVKGSGQNPTAQTLTDDFESAFNNGWQGVQPWTSNGVDSLGGSVYLTPATNAFYGIHAQLVFPPSG